MSRFVTIEDVSIESAFLKAGKGLFNICLPADYQTSGKRYPVLYLLHGVFENNRSWEKKGHFSSILGDAVKAGDCGEFITVMPDGGLSFYVDGYTFLGMHTGDRWQPFFLKELMPYVESHYPVLTGRENTAIAGFSMGGYGAMHNAVTHPELFRFCFSMSGCTEGFDWTGLIRGIPGVIPSIGNVDSLPELHMDCGSCDPVCGKSNLVTPKRLSARGIPHTSTFHPGSHTWSFWQGSLRRMLKLSAFPSPPSRALQSPARGKSIPAGLRP